MKRNILLCVAGGTPQIITETLWALKEKGERVDEIRVITTSEGRRKMLEGIIVDERGNVRGAADESLLDKDDGQFYEFQKEFPEYAGNIKFDENCLYILTTKTKGVPSPRDSEKDWLKDILTDEDNEKIANQICEIVRELAADENIRLHASIAGGRKTMSLYLMTAMQLFAKNDDTMSHVLVSKEVEFGAPKFFYKPQKSEPILDPNGNSKTKADGSNLTTVDVSIYLAEIPFIRLRGVGGDFFDKPIENYAEFVSKTENELKYLEGAKELRLNLKEKSVSAFNRKATFSIREIFVYVMFAYFRKNDVGENGYVGLDEITETDLEKVCRLFVEAEADESAIDVFREKFKRTHFIYKLDEKIVRENMLEKKQQDYLKEGLKSPREANVTRAEASKKVMNDYRQIMDKITAKLKDAEIDMRFDIDRKGEKNGYIFGLKIEPKRIQFE
ncbi:hypothetical protein BH20ACI4_BH20ACI4_15540 [soil metagenome]